MERAQQHAVLDGGLAAVGLVPGMVHLAAPAGWVQPPAHWQCRSRSSTALRIPAGTVSAYPMSSGRLGPPRRAPSCRRRRNEASPPGPDRRSTALPITACSSAAQAAVVPRPGLAALAELVQFDAEPDQVLQRVHVDIAGHDGRHRGVAGDRLGGVPVQPRAVGRAGLGGVRAARGPPRPDLLRPLVLQGGVAVEQHRSAREICAQALTGCPARSGSRFAAASRRIASASAS